MADRAPFGIREYRHMAGDRGGLANEWNPRSGDFMEAIIERFGDAYVTIVL